MQEQAPNNTDNNQSDSFSPFYLRVECLDRMLNFEIVNHPVYSGLEIQGHEANTKGNIAGHGILVFLQRRGTGLTDVYVEKTLHLNESSRKLFSLGSGLGVWKDAHEFEMAELHVSSENGVHAELLFYDAEGRHIYVKISDETPFSPAHRNMCRCFLAPVGAAIETPQALPLIYMKEFDLLTRNGTPPIITIDGQEAKTGSMPCELCLSKRLIKVAKDLVIAPINPSMEDDGASNSINLCKSEGGDLTSITAHKNGHCATMTFDPSFPNMAKALNGGPEHHQGRWRVGIDDDTRLVSGTWTTQRNCPEGDQHDHQNVQVQLDVTKGWRPKGLPWLTKIITTLVPIFQTWPESYQWIGTVKVINKNNLALQSFRWQRIGQDRGESYSKAFGGK